MDIVQEQLKERIISYARLIPNAVNVVIHWRTSTFDVYFDGIHKNTYEALDGGNRFREVA